MRILTCPVCGDTPHCESVKVGRGDGRNVIVYCGNKNCLMAINALPIDVWNDKRPVPTPPTPPARKTEHRWTEQNPAGSGFRPFEYAVRWWDEGPCWLVFRFDADEGPEGDWTPDEYSDIPAAEIAKLAGLTPPEGE